MAHAVLGNPAGQAYPAVMGRYEDVFRRSLADPAGFWSEAATAVDWYQDPQVILDDWLALYHEVARGNGGEPDAGRRMHAWARAAGLDDVMVSTSTWTYATPEDRDWWGGLWADRTVKSAYAANATGGGYATTADLERIADGWRAWAADPDAWFLVPNGEVLGRVS